MSPIVRKIIGLILMIAGIVAATGTIALVFHLVLTRAAVLYLLAASCALLFVSVVAITMFFLGLIIFEDAYSHES